MIDALAVTTDEGREGVDARALHEALGVGRDFSTWIREAVERFGLVVGQDYVTAQGLRTPESGSAKAREQVSTDYALSLPAAKLIAISTRGPAAVEARKALLEIEERWNSPAAVMARALQMAHAELARTKHATERALAELTPKAEALDRLAAARGDVCLQDAGRILARQPNVFVRTLIEDGVLFRGAHGKPEPRGDLRERGLFSVRVKQVDREAYVQTFVTPAGLIWLSERYPATDRVAGVPPQVDHLRVLPLGPADVRRGEGH